MDGKPQSNYMLSTKDIFYIQRHKQVESERVEKDITHQQYPKESWNGYTNIRQIDFKTKIVTETNKYIL